MLTISRSRSCARPRSIGNWQLELYSGADHAFTTPDSPANDRANVRAWGGNAEIFCRSLQELKQCAEDGRCSWVLLRELSKPTIIFRKLSTIGQQFLPIGIRLAHELNCVMKFLDGGPTSPPILEDHNGQDMVSRNRSEETPH